MIGDRLEKIRAIIQGQQDLEAIEEKVLASGAGELRQSYFARRQCDDDWYFKKYQVNFCDGMY